MTRGISLSEVLDGQGGSKAAPLQRMLRADMNLVAGILEKSGRNSDWAEIDGFAEAEPELQKQLAAAFPKGPREMLNLMSDGAGNWLDAQIWNGGIEVYGTGPGLKQLHRIIYPGDTLNLKSIELDKSVQGYGKGVRILLGTFKAAEKLGIKKMQMHADKAGAYVWARAGFVPDDGKEWNVVRYYAEKRLAEMEKDLAPEAAAEFKAVLNDSNPRAIWALADLEHKMKDGDKVSRKLLVNNDWMAHLDMNDAEAVKRLKDYAKSRRQ